MMRKVGRTCRLFAMSVSVFSAACGVGDRSTSARAEVATVRDSGGVTIVENRAAAAADVAAWRVDTVAALSIGATGDTAYEFNQIGSIQQLPNGMILVLDGSGETAFQFRFYDSTGKHLATHGRQGQGPGEHRWINFVGSVGGDTVVGVDFPNSRLAWVSASRGYLRSARHDDRAFKRLLGDSAGGLIETLVPLGDSVYAVTAFHDRIGPDGAFERATSYHIVDLARGTALATRRYDVPPARHVQLSTRRTSVLPTGSGNPVRVVDRARRRLCSALTTIAVIDCVAADGQRRSIRWSAEAVPYTDADHRAFSESVRRSRMTQRGITPADVEKILSAMGRPERHPPFSLLQLDTDGNFWVREYTVDELQRRRARFRVFDPDGRHIAYADSFPTPRMGFGYGIHIGSDALLRVVRDSDDVPSVAKFAIRKPD